MQPQIDALKVFPFLENDLTSLKGELPAYLSAPANVSPVTDVLEWWRKHESSLPHWEAARKRVLLIQPLSAAVEWSPF